ncbi:MAG: phosphoribosylglycinamide formyltransferase, partial [Gammaproteobacteria bacterium]|nr:phosphoribosylglycinamide formyltransferase [Gammaproteobacteria bacterium]
SGNGSNLQAILDAIRTQNLPCAVQAVISNRKEAYGLTRAEHANIPTHIIDLQHFQNKNAFETALATCIESYRPELIVMAGFMFVLSARFVKRYEGKIINIHPSLLPLYRGLHTHQRVLASKERIHGATVHFATEELDAGPNIIQATVPVYNTDTADSLAERVLEKEHIILPLAIRWFAEGRLRKVGHQAFLDGKPLPSSGFLLKT